MAHADDENSPLLKYLDGLVEDLHKNVSKALRDFDAEAIHDARVATRRLRAATKLLSPVLSDERRKPFDKVLRKLRRRLGSLRDLDVMIENLTKLAAETAQGSAAGYMKERLARQQSEERDRTRKKTSAADFLSRLGCWYSVREEIAESAEAIDSLLSESLHLQFDAFAEQSVQLGNDPAAHRNDPHQLRIAGKSLRYTLEMAKEQGHKLPASILKAFKKMQEALGDWHDDVVLVQCAMSMSLDQMLAYHRPATQDQMLKLARLFLVRSERELGKFAKLWEKHGSQVADAIRQRFPLSQLPQPQESDASKANEPKTGPGPSGSSDTPAPEAPSPDAPSNA
jgi:CHAD domain-containing protein